MAVYATRVSSNTVAGALESGGASGPLVLSGWSGLGRVVSASVAREIGFAASASVPNLSGGVTLATIESRLSARFSAGTAAPSGVTGTMAAADTGAYPIAGVGMTGFPLSHADAASAPLTLTARQIAGGFSASVVLTGDHVVRSGSVVIDDPLIPMDTAYAQLTATYQVAARAYGNAADRLVATAFADVVEMLGGNDTVSGLGGNDVLVGGAGADRLYGGDGLDRLIGGDDADVLVGGAGDDTLWGGAADDYLNGEAGSDQMIGDAGDDGLYGFGGNDVMTGDAGRDTLSGGAGNDRLRGGDDGDVLDGGSGDDLADGGTGADVLRGGDGNDTLIGGAGADTLGGGAGDDSLSGGSEGNVLNGAAGDDTLAGGDAADRLFGGAGADSLTGAGGADLMLGGSGDDRIVGGDGNDWLYGEQGCDNLFGGDGADRLASGGNAGGWSPEWLAGGAGNDTLIGGDGGCWFLGEAGTDVMIGGLIGASADRFEFRAASDSRAGALRDVIQNFDPDEDLILLKVDADVTRPGAQSFGTIAEGPAAHAVWSSVQGGNTLILGDVDGDAVADMEILLAGVGAIPNIELVVLTYI